MNKLIAFYLFPNAGNTCTVSIAGLLNKSEQREILTMTGGLNLHSAQNKSQIYCAPTVKGIFPHR